MLTLTQSATENSAGKYYWYKVSSADVKSIKFTDFTVMGGTEKFHSVTETENIPENETFLLSVDFSKASASPVNGQKVVFKLLPSETEEDAVTMGETVAYDLISVSQGNISVSGQTAAVDTLPQDADRLTGQTIFLKAVIKSLDSSKVLPYNVNATWSDTTGNWISRDTVLFALGTYGSIQENLSGEYTFVGLSNGSYQIAWSLVYGEKADGNIAGNVVSNTETSVYPESHTEPSLKVTTDAGSRAIVAGTVTTVKFSYVSTSADVEVTVEKQGNLCEFGSVSNGVTVELGGNGQANVVFGETAAAGTYRVCFSLDEDSSNDNVYFTFVVK